MLGFIKSTPENLKLILANLQNSTIMDLLLTLIRLEELPEAKGIVQVGLYGIRLWWPFLTVNCSG